MMDVEGSPLFRNCLDFNESLLKDLREEIAVLVITAVQGTASVCADVCVQRIRTVHKQMVHEFLVSQEQRKVNMREEQCQTDLPCVHGEREVPALAHERHLLSSGLERDHLVQCCHGHQDGAEWQHVKASLHQQEACLQAQCGEHFQSSTRVLSSPDMGEACQVQTAHLTAAAQEQAEDCETEQALPSDEMEEAPLALAVRDHDLLRVQALLFDGANPNAQNACGEFILTEAAGLCDLNCVAVLLAYRADPGHLQSADLEAMDDEFARDACSLCTVFRQRRAGSHAERSLLMSLCPGVQAYVRAWMDLDEEALPCSESSLPPSSCLGADRVSILEASEHHQVALHMPESMRPLLVLSPLWQAATAVVILLHGMFQSAQTLEHLARDLAQDLPHVQFLVPTAPTRRCVSGAGPSWLDQLEDSRSEIMDLLQKARMTALRAVDK